MNQDDFDEANSIVDRHLQWQSPPIIVPTVASQSGKTVNLDITSIIQKVTRNGGGRASQPSVLMNACHFIPAFVFNTTDTKPKAVKEKITGYLETACAKAGFSVVAGRNRLNKDGTIRKHDYCCY